MQNFSGRTFTGRQGRKWLGGFVRVGADGKETFIIEKKLGGRKFKVSTQRHTEPAALAELARWEKDPEAYVAGGEAGDRVQLTEDLIRRYLEFQTGVKRNTADHYRLMAGYLADWAEALDGRDLRTLRLDHFENALRFEVNGWKPGTVRKRIMAIKGFYTFLSRDHRVMTPQQNVARALRIPEASPEQWKTPKVVEQDDVAAVLDVCEQPTRDVLHLKLGTAWHTSEVRRFIDAGTLTKIDGAKAGEPIATLRTIHKSGEPHTTPLMLPEHVAAAERLLALREVAHSSKGGKKLLGLPDKTWLAKQMRRACAKASAERMASRRKVKTPIKFCLDQIRHSVLTWAYRAGASLEDVSAFAGHKDLSTTRRFYVDMGKPTTSVPVKSFALHA